MTPKSSAKILIVDDHPLVRRGLAELISEAPGLTVCGEASGTADALACIARERPDLVVIDLALNEGSGMELIKQIRLRDETIKMLVSTMHDENLYAERSLRAGASGFIHKGEATEKVVTAIRQVLSGKVYLSKGMSERMLSQLTGARQDAGPKTVDDLSDRELEVFELIGEGFGTRRIAERLHLSPKTIETHRENIKRKLGLRTSGELTRHAVKWVYAARGTPIEFTS